jgi:site-specific recombinase XerD
VTSSNQVTCVDRYLDSFEQSLAAEDYKFETLRQYRCLLRRFGGLIEAEGVAPSALTPDLAIQLARQLPAVRKNSVKIPNLAKRFVLHLIELGVAPPLSVTAAQAARAELLGDFESYLIRQRGLSRRSVYQAVRYAHRFLDHRFGDGPLDLSSITAPDIVAFMEYLLARKRPFLDKTPASHLRCFFQYLFMRAITAANLSLCVPKMHKRWNAHLPRHLSPHDVEAILASVQADPRHGVRNYAMLLLMARLGLRVPEIMTIQLDDIDWRTGELLIRGKGQRHDRLPIPSDVGEAISRYLREDRSSTTTRILFVTHKAPSRPFKDSRIINKTLKRAYAATGIKPPTPYVGSHVLRHSLATNMVRAGVSLEEVGDLLRHRSRKSTMIYAKLDAEGLISIAQPWPTAEGAR